MYSGSVRYHHWGGEERSFLPHPTLLRGRHGHDAIWRWIKVISFEVTIPDAEQNKRLPEKLRKELPDIPAWAVCVLRGATDALR